MSVKDVCGTPAYVQSLPPPSMSMLRCTSSFVGEPIVFRASDHSQNVPLRLNVACVAAGASTHAPPFHCWTLLYVPSTLKRTCQVAANGNDGCCVDPL